MNKGPLFVFLVAVCVSVAWMGVTRGKLARVERERRELEMTNQELAGQLEQARAFIGQLEGELSRQHASAAGPVIRAGGGRSEILISSTASEAQMEPGTGAPRAWSLPAVVNAGLEQRFGSLEIRDAQPSILEGRSAFMIRGVTADGRAIGAIITPEGAVLSSKAEVLVESLPGSVGAAIRELGAETSIQKAREIQSAEGALEYVLSGQSADGRAIHLNVSSDGRITSGDVERSVQDVPEQVRNTVTATLADRSPASVREIFGDKGTFYEVGFKDAGGSIQMVIDDAGRLVSFTSKASSSSNQREKKMKP